MNKQDDNWETVSRFGLLAERFCSLVDGAATLDRTEFLVQVYRLLPDLMAEAIRLPDIEYEDDADEDADDDTDLDVEAALQQFKARAEARHPEWSQRYRSLQEKLGDWDSYRQVFDPTEDDEAIHMSLADDIADIYGDLKDGINLKESGQASAEDVIFEWRFGYYAHWGRHAINALGTIHVLLEDELTGLNRPD